jgi:hypothetical protein
MVELDNVYLFRFNYIRKVTSSEWRHIPCIREHGSV